MHATNSPPAKRETTFSRERHLCAVVMGAHVPVGSRLAPWQGVESSDSVGLVEFHVWGQAQSREFSLNSPIRLPGFG